MAADKKYFDDVFLPPGFVEMFPSICILANSAKVICISSIGHRIKYV